MATGSYDRPQSTYRLQFHGGEGAFTFADAADIVDYLADLGITHAYASPYFAAKAGSTHGYDVIDPCRLNPEIGTRDEYERWLNALKRRQMSHILDIVPNHVGVATNDNAWWNDVLAHGRQSKFADFFDINWDSSPRPDLHGKVLLPVLGSPYGDVLDKGELKLKHEDGRWWVYYYDRRFPIDPATAPKSADALRSADDLHGLLERQHYRLCYWRVASDEINYRRFFDINDLAGLRMERQEVFEATHQLIFELLREGKVSGLRVDHPDGLLDPKQYLQRLGESGERYVVVEKILAADEPLPTDWPCNGTSGYDFLNKVNGLFVDSSSQESLTDLYADWIGERVEFEDLVYEKKKLILEFSLASELRVLAWQLDRLAQRDRRTRDFTFAGLHAALREVIACFPVYRSYVTGEGASESDVRHVEAAVRAAIERNPKTEPSIFHLIGDIVLLRSPLGADPDAVRFAGKFQQLTAPTTAKGIEDTAFYLYNRLISLNEVGGDPGRFGVSPAELHAYFADRQRHWPDALSALSTHDTKRSEDVRARINVLSEMPDEWRQHVMRWEELTQSIQPRPSRNDEYLLYQTLVGAWPIQVERVRAYLLKAVREAKAYSSWTDPNGDYENAVTSFAAAAMTHRPFLDDFLPFQSRVAEFGLINSLAQTLLKIAAPGVPDAYQGTELIDLSLVDPDNRRPVDYDRRRGILAELAKTNQPPKDELMKPFVTWKALTCRRDHAPLFTQGEYIALQATGPAAQHVFAFARRYGQRTAVCAVPRLICRMRDQGLAWHDSHLNLPDVEFTNVFTSERVRSKSLVDLFLAFPVALLIA